MKNAKYGNGDKVIDKVTGLEGIVMVVAEYSTGCIHCGILPEILKNDGTVHEWSWMDQSRLELVQKKAVVFDIDDKIPGGPAPCGPEV